MTGSWDDDDVDGSLLFLPSDDVDDDPSSYLLYPPGFGPVNVIPSNPQLQEQEQGEGDKPGSKDLILGLSEELSGKISLADMSSALDSAPLAQRFDLSEVGEAKKEFEEAQLHARDDDDDDDSLTSSSSSSSSSDDDDEEEEEDEKERDGDLEEGEIGDVGVDEGMMSSDEELEGPRGPIKSKNEIEDLPHVPPVNATLEPHHQTFAVGIVSSVVGCRVIVEGVEKHSPLTEGSILWVTSTRSPLGIIDEIFGPVKNPYYIVRFNSATEVSADIAVGTAISYATEFADHVLNLPSLYKKGYDASGENDEELDEDAEFSDDEKEAEYRRSLRQPKHRQQNSDPSPFAQKKPFDRTSRKDRPPPQQQQPQPPQFQGHGQVMPPAQPFAPRPEPPPAQAQIPVAMPLTQFGMGQFQMPPMAAGLAASMAAFGGQGFFPNPFWPQGIVNFPGMLPQMQNQALAGFTGGMTFPGFQLPFAAQAPNPTMLPQAVSPWTGNQGPPVATTPPGTTSGEEVQAGMLNGGHPRPFGRGGRPFGGRGGFRGRGRGRG